MTPVSIVPAIAVLVLALPAPAHADGESSWADRISIKGDLRLRQEGIDEDGEENRNRARYRARLGLKVAVRDDVNVVMQIASGADDPVSRNVTFDGGFTTKDIGFDLAYVDWAFADGWHFYGGKMRNPLYKAGGASMIWDGDLNPEGFAAKFSKGPLFGTVAGFSVEERSSSDDSLLTAVQLGGKFDVAENIRVTAGVGYFAYSNTRGNEPFFNGKAKGNSVDLAGNYINDYKNTEVFGQLDTQFGDWPLVIYGQWTQNNEVGAQDSAYAVGAKLGSAKEKGGMQFGWTYKDVEADAVIATFSDSDFGGGGTDASGHIFKAKYALSPEISLGGALFINEVDAFQATKHDYKRFQIDLQFSFK